LVPAKQLFASPQCAGREPIPFEFADRSSYQADFRHVAGEAAIAICGDSQAEVVDDELRVGFMPNAEERALQSRN